MESNFTSVRLEAWRIFTKRPWASSSPGESLHSKARPTVKGIQKRYGASSTQRAHLLSSHQMGSASEGRTSGQWEGAVSWKKTGLSL